MGINRKTVFAIFVITIVAVLQVAAWSMGFNGTIFAFTSLLIGLVCGSILEFSFNKIHP